MSIWRLIHDGYNDDSLIIVVGVSVGLIQPSLPFCHRHAEVRFVEFFHFGFLVFVEFGTKCSPFLEFYDESKRSR